MMSNNTVPGLTALHKYDLAFNQIVHVMTAREEGKENQSIHLQQCHM